MQNSNSNYEKMKNIMAETFLSYDQEHMIQKFSLKANLNYLYLPFVGHIYRIDRFFGNVQWSDDNFQTVNTADYNETMTIYDVLCNSKEHCHLAHEFVNISALSSVKTGNLTQNGGFFQHNADFFDGKTAELHRACQTLHGKPLNKGDVACELELFPFLPLIIRFWESDEEFPASLQILADKNTLDYMHYETLMFALTHLFHRIQEEMNLL